MSQVDLKNHAGNDLGCCIRLKRIYRAIMGWYREIYKILYIYMHVHIHEDIEYLYISTYTYMYVKRFLG